MNQATRRQLADLAAAHPLDQADHFADLFLAADEAAGRAIAALGLKGVDEGVRAAALRQFCSMLATTVASLDEETDRHPVPYDDRARWTGIPGRLQRLWQKIDAVGADVSDRTVRLAQRLPKAERLQRAWWLVGLLITVVAGGFVVRGSFTVAAALMASRWAGSLAAGGPAVATGARGLVAIDEQSDIRRHLLTSCVASHAADLILTLAAAWRLQATGLGGWANITMAAIALSLLASLFRIAAERNGVQVRRSAIERLARNAGVAAALTLSVVGSGDLLGWIPPLAFVGLGSAIYAVGEVFRIGMALGYDPRPKMAVTLSVDASETARFSGVRDPRIGVRGPRIGADPLPQLAARAVVETTSARSHLTSTGGIGTTSAPPRGARRSAS